VDSIRASTQVLGEPISLLAHVFSSVKKKKKNEPISPIPVGSAPPDTGTHEKRSLLKFFDRFCAAIGRPVKENDQPIEEDEVPYKSMGPKDTKFSVKTVRVLVSPDVDEYMPCQPITQSGVGTVPPASCLLQQDSWRKSKDATRPGSHSTRSSATDANPASAASRKSNTNAA
jgi:hypothetical protein